MDQGGRRTRSLLLFFLFFGSALQLAGSQECSGHGSRSGGPGPDGLCPCQPGWQGADCNVCTPAADCSLLLAGGSSCRTDLEAVQEVGGWCRAPSDDTAALIHGTGWVNFAFQTDGNFYFELWKQALNNSNRTYHLKLFRCSSSHTKETADPQTDLVRFTSSDVKCQLSCVVGGDRTCTAFLKQVIGQVGANGGSTMTCNPSKRTCEIHEEVLDNFLGGVITDQCLVGECVVAPAPQPEPQPTPAPPHPSPAPTPVPPNPTLAPFTGLPEPAPPTRDPHPTPVPEPEPINGYVFLDFTVALTFSEAVDGADINAADTSSTLGAALAQLLSIGVEAVATDDVYLNNGAKGEKDGVQVLYNMFINRHLRGLTTTAYYIMFIDITVTLPISDSHMVTIGGGQCDADNDNLLVVVDGLLRDSYVTGSLSRLIQAKAAPGSVLSRLVRVNKDLSTVPLELYYGHTPDRLQAGPPPKKAAAAGGSESNSSSKSTLLSSKQGNSRSALVGIIVIAGVVLSCVVLAIGVVYVYLKRTLLITDGRGEAGV